MDKTDGALEKGIDRNEGRPDSDVWEEEIQMMMGTRKGTGLALVVPPKPPPKDTPKVIPALKRPAPTHQSTPSRASTSSRSTDAVKALKPLSLRQPIQSLGMNPPTRPGTATTERSRVGFASTTQTKMIESSRRVSWSTYTTSKKPIKYGKGKFSHIELNPQPSDDPKDPLNWPQWRKELNLAALLFMVALTGVEKTMFIGVTNALAEDYEVSYTAAAALTGVPLMLSALTGLASLVTARIWGKRPLYLASLLLVFIGATWNTNNARYGQRMTERICQGLAWGAFDTLIMSSIFDTYFEHERWLRVAIYSTVCVATTWGPPLISGVTAQSTGLGSQFAIFSACFIIAAPLMVLGAPETAFDRAYNLAQTPASSCMKSLPPTPRKAFSLETFKGYVSKLKVVVYTTDQPKTASLCQVPRALIAPTTLLLFIVNFIPSAALWGLSFSLSLLFSPSPFLLTSTTLGLLATGPFLLATLTTAVFAFWSAYHLSFSAKRHNAIAIAAGSAAALIPPITLGLYLGATAPQPAPQTPSNLDDLSSTAALNELSQTISLPLVSLLLGLLATSVAILHSTVQPLIRRSTAFTSSNLGVALKNTADMDAGLSIWQSFFAGVFVIGLPHVVLGWEGVKGVCLGISIGQVFVGAVVAGVWWFYDERVRTADGYVMRCVEGREGSFFDRD